MAERIIEEVLFHDRIMVTGQHSMQNARTADGYTITYDTEMQHYSIKHPGNRDKMAVDLLIPRERINRAVPPKAKVEPKK